MRKSLAASVALLSAVSVVVACSSDKPPAVPATTIDGGTEAGAAVADASAAMPADAGPVATGPVFFTGDAGAPAPSTAASTTPAVPVVTEQAMDVAIDLAVTTVAPKVAPKMDKEGQPGRATLKEGEHFGMVVNLQPNRCYTIVGFSPPGSVAQLDMKLFALPLNVQAGTSSPSDKATPVIGKGKDALCPILPVVVPYKVDAVATKGAGRIGIQVYSRAK
jgi:hypothetical protein